ncbi:hypothetical protein D3C73_1119840 [compost metagenome]
MRRFGLNPSNRFLHQFRRHIVQHDNIRSCSECLLNLLKTFRLHFNGHGVRNVGAGPADSLENTACTFDMIVLNHHSIIQSKAVVRAAADTHSIFLQHPVSRCCLTGIYEPCGQTFQGFHKSRRPRSNPRQPLHQIKCKPLTGQNGMSASFYLSKYCSFGHLLSFLNQRCKYE